ncbi:MAM and LDL-receptor class A domain-containing protein 1-like [Procambarus clarkii]|uniref:MAM and LDL-receptor class A domain-containing protein 1-like n=1 Tax=Procambarus clarkii TaxID=6728 RepID=UPI003742CBB0
MRNSDYAKISVDDFTFTRFSGECPHLPTAATAAPSSSTLTPPGSVTCDFSEDECGWVNVDARGIHWQHNNEAGDMELVLEGTESNQYYLGVMRSPVFTIAESTSSCLSLIWFMVTQYEAHFSVVIQDEFGQDLDFLMNVNDGSNDQWKSTNMDLSKAGSFRIAIKGTVTSQWQGSMAFTSVELLDKPCSEEVKGGGLWCDFETPEECGFRNSLPGDTTVWTWGSSSPNLDHTLDSHLGHTMYLDVSTVGKGKLAHLVTPAISPEDQTFCLTFWFYMLGQDVATLTIYAVQNKTQSLPLWTQHQSFREEWRGASVSTFVNLDANFSVVFEAFTGKDTWGSLAIDDVMITPGFCPDPATCTFDDGLCLWTQSYSDDLDWEVVNVAGDLHDHTNESGNFLALRIDTSASPDKSAVLESQPVELLEAACFSFWYNMWGSNVGRLKVDNSGPDFTKVTLWELAGPQTEGSEWKYAALSVPPAGAFNMITVEGIIGNIGNGTIAIDGIELKNVETCIFEPPEAEVGTPAPMTTTPVPTPSPGYSFFCDFEDSTNAFCDWQDLSDQDFKWTIVKGALNIEGIGPVGDHTTGSGHYSTTFRNADALVEVVSVLASPSIESTQIKCFVFWYFLWGDTVTLTMKVNAVNNWSRKGSQGNKWVPAKVDINTKNQSLELILEAVLGEDHEDSYVSLDDTYYYNVTCENVDVGTRTERQCDFEEADLCDWGQVIEEDNANWDWVNGSQGAAGSDHSYNAPNGHYLELTSIMQGSGTQKKAMLQLPPFQNMPAGDYCFQLYYIRFGGVRIGNISILVEFSGIITPIVELNDKEGTMNWTLIQQTYKNNAHLATVGFVVSGEVGAASADAGESVIAIDDYSFTTTACPQPGSCTFEDAHMCMWHVEMSEDVVWQLTDGRESHSNGPKVDHTTNTSSGGYVMVEDSGEHANTATALVSSHIPNDVYGFCFSFFYSMSGDDEARLKISSRSDDGKNIIWSLTGQQGPDWLYGQVGIPGSTRGEFEIVIEGVTGSYSSGWIALDDLFTSTGDCVTLPSAATPTPLPSTTPNPPSDIFNCDFEEDMCSMIQVTSDDFDWFYQHEEDDFELPPGGYMLMDATGHSNKEKAVIKTPEITYLGLQCISFRYRFIGCESGVLLMFFSFRETRSEALWQRHTTTIPDWISANIELNAGDAYSLEWEAQVVGEDSLILLDNIVITAEGCPVERQTCNFEYESQTDLYCGGYQSGSPTDFQFFRTYAAESAHKYSSDDHTYQSAYGYYVVLDFAKASTGGQVATMDGPNILEDSNCLTFWYQFKTVDTTAFRAITNDTQDIIFSVEVGTGSWWQLGSGKVPSSTSTRHVVFQAFFGGTPDGYVEIDDIKLDNSDVCPYTWEL